MGTLTSPRHDAMILFPSLSRTSRTQSGRGKLVAPRQSRLLLRVGRRPERDLGDSRHAPSIARRRGCRPRRIAANAGGARSPAFSR